MRKTVLAILVSFVAVLLTSTVVAPAQAFVDKDCADFPTQAAAQAFFLAAGGPSNDPHALDYEGDGLACESNPCPCSTSQGGGAPSSTTTPPKPKPSPPVYRDQAIVLKVTDGDTIKVRVIGGRIRDVRLIGIDTPEVYGGVECGGREASRSMKQMLPWHTRVSLVSDPTQDATDRYGRILRYVSKGSLDVGRRQIYKGHAEVYVYGGNPFQRTGLYRKVETDAKRLDNGIWRNCR